MGIVEVKAVHTGLQTQLGTLGSGMPTLITFFSLQEEGAVAQSPESSRRSEVKVYIHKKCSLGTCYPVYSLIFFGLMKNKI